MLVDEEAQIEKFLLEVRPRLKLLANTIDIDADDFLEAKKVNRELILRRKLKPILRDFDFVIIDTPPAMRAATLNGLAVADVVVIPIDSSYFALLGLSQLLHVVAAIREAHKPDMVIRALTKSELVRKKQCADVRMLASRKGKTKQVTVSKPFPVRCTNTNPIANLEEGRKGFFMKSLFGKLRTGSDRAGTVAGFG
jgi:chromosome partitioning protein